MLISSETLESLRASVNSSVSEWSAMLEIPTKAFARTMSAPLVSVSEKTLDRLANALEVTPEDILNGSVDFKLLAQRAAGHATALPEKYSRARYSKVRTSAYLLDYIEIRYGWQVRNRILQHFQINESIIADPDMQISIRFLADLCDYLTIHGFALSGFHEIGKFSSTSNSSGTLASLFRQEVSPMKAYERCFAELIDKYYDQNNVYTLRSLYSQSCSVEAQPHPRLLDDSDGHFFSNESICVAKGGGFASIMDYLSLPDAKVVEAECVNRGDQRCRYEIDFELAAWTHNQRGRGPSNAALLSMTELS
jgi:DNA-binding Xre family transcriptional regulator